VLTLIGIIVLRQVNISTLENDENYLVNFRVWRGASYLLCFNWIMGLVLTIFDRLRINYRLILIDHDRFIGKPQSFFMTATILSAIYLLLFLIFTLKSLNLIQGYDHLINLGYYMWLINIVFMLNPFKVMNYDSRKYFLSIIWQILLSYVTHCSINVYINTIVMGSWVQPFSDLYFTTCVLIHGPSDCSFQS